MENRVYKRVPANIKIRYYLYNPLFWKNLYTGNIKNLSEKGLFISTKTIYFPLDALLEISIPFKKRVLNLPAKISSIAWRSVVSDNCCDGIGVELSDPPQEYLEFVDSLKTVNKSQYNTPISNLWGQILKRFSYR
jgi:Tfp pilus assembly protein PilZ